MPAITDSNIPASAEGEENTEKEFMTAIRTGRDRDTGRPILPPIKNIPPQVHATAPAVTPAPS
ncbi:MAG: hypothetical protein MPW14_11760 [Candidatus Manganitrophus sp.]|nr:hypothetical protein [Candidatus Manganitrophus sp.]WDT70427.1 MAG: hypothetical protein MPW17_16945 [Candidatus Manganitrophus sp.]WDT82341.1 MAG: hypothetical protein MPW14_11760 [Candidatus Manganitrophus sp.]